MDKNFWKTYLVFLICIVFVVIVVGSFLSLGSVNEEYVNAGLHFKRDIIREKIELGMTPKSMTLIDLDYVRKYNKEVLKFRDLNERDNVYDVAINDSSLASLPVFIYEKKISLF